MYYNEYFFFLKERLPEKCYDILKECYENHKDEVENAFSYFQNLKFGETYKDTNIFIPREDSLLMAYEILVREQLIDVTEDGRYMLDRFGVYLLHYLNK